MLFSLCYLKLACKFCNVAPKPQFEAAMKCLRHKNKIKKLPHLLGMQPLHNCHNCTQQAKRKTLIVKIHKQSICTNRKSLTVMEAIMYIYINTHIHKRDRQKQACSEIQENRTIKSQNLLPAGLLASFPCKLNTFRKRVKNVVTRKGLQVGIECK